MVILARKWYHRTLTHLEKGPQILIVLLLEKGRQIRSQMNRVEISC